MSSKDEKENENDKTLMSSNKDDENENDHENGNEDDETMSQNKKIYKNKKHKWLFRWNNWQVKIIWTPNKIDKKSRKFRWVLV